MSKIAVLGLGTMGSRMAARLLAAGHAVTVWNRSPGRDADLREAGAKAAATPREAVQDVEAAVAMVRDDAASREVWLNPQTGALAALPKRAVAIDSSTVSLAWARELAAAAAAAGSDMLDAPVSGSRPQAEAGQLVYLVGGDAAVLQRVEPILQAMGGAVLHAGPAGAGAALKLAVNALYAAQAAEMAELLGWAARAGFDPARFAELIGQTPVCAPVMKVAGAAMAAGRFDPLFPVELVEKDLGYMAAEAARSGAEAPLTAATRAVFRRALDQGLGDLNITAAAKLYR